MKINFSKKILILSILLLLAISVLDVIFINLLIDKIYSIKDKENQLNISTQEREKELLLRESIGNSVVNRALLEEYFVPDGNLETVKFTEYLEKLASDMNLEHKKSLDYEPASEMTNSEFVSAIRFRFNVSGSWQNVFDFLRTIENLPKISYLSGINLTMNTSDISVKDGKNKTWSLDLDFSVIKLK
jgi:Tfp pilus assembly protein PilO